MAAATVRLLAIGTALTGAHALRVRREIRSLSEAQRVAVFAALTTMKTTPQDAGEALYGPDFLNYERFVVKHAHAAMHPRCDQGHYGPAFVTYHRAFTLLMENALLAVDPSIEGLPYWDYNIDLAEYADPRDSIVWTEAFFGENEGDATDGWMIRDGPFAAWEVATNASALAPDLLLSPSGFLRGPTNVQFAPRLTRSSSICGVRTPTTFSLANWSTCLDAPPEGSTFDGFFDCVDAGMGGVHSFAHRWLGGAWGAADGNCAAKQDGPSIADRLSGCMVCPAACAADDAAPCVCKRDEAACAAAAASGACQKYPGGDGHEWLGEADTPCATCGDACADGELGANGDFWDGCTSPNDPVFWFHHPNVDRLAMEWQLRNAAGNGTPLPHSGFPTDGHCAGHTLHDIMSETDPFAAALVVGWPAAETAGSPDPAHRAAWARARRPMTNAELLDATVPLANAPYTYDTLIGARAPTLPWADGAAAAAAATAANGAAAPRRDERASAVERDAAAIVA